jgi:hypothetical protein
MAKVTISLPDNTQIVIEAEEAELLRDVVGMALRGGHGIMPPSANHSAHNENGVAEKGTDVASDFIRPEDSAAAGPLPQPAANGGRHEDSAAASPLPQSAANGGRHEDSAATGPLPQSAANGGRHEDSAAASPLPQPAANGGRHEDSAAPGPLPQPAANGGSPQPTPAPRRQEPTSASIPELEEDDDPDALHLEEHSPQSRVDFAAYCSYVNPMGDMRRVVVAADGAGRFFNADGVDAEDLGNLFDLAGWRRPGNFTQTLRNAARSKFGWLERVPGRSGRYAVTDLGRSVTAGG